MSEREGLWREVLIENMVYGILINLCRAKTLGMILNGGVTY